MPNSSKLLITVDRDSVCAGDDVDSHQKIISVSPSCSMLELLDLAWAECPLASISGGRATWLIEVEGSGENCIGVMAQQWEQPRLLISAQTKIETLFQDKKRLLFFRYWCSADPDEVYQAVLKNMSLPSRYGPTRKI